MAKNPGYCRSRPLRSFGIVSGRRFSPNKAAATPSRRESGSPALTPGHIIDDGGFSDMAPGLRIFGEPPRVLASSPGPRSLRQFGGCSPPLVMLQHTQTTSSRPTKPQPLPVDVKAALLPSHQDTSSAGSSFQPWPAIFETIWWLFAPTSLLVRSAYAVLNLFTLLPSKTWTPGCLDLLLSDRTRSARRMGISGYPGVAVWLSSWDECAGTPTVTKMTKGSSQ
jgi:hypothetical protein